MSRPTIVVQLPIIDTISDIPLADRITNECDVKWAAGYRLAGTATPSPASIVLIFQLKVDYEA